MSVYWNNDKQSDAFKENQLTNISDLWSIKNNLECPASSVSREWDS